MSDTTDITVYHNPKCGTSRSVLALLEEHGVEHETVLYMNDKLSRDDFDSILGMLTDLPTISFLMNSNDKLGDNGPNRITPEEAAARYLEYQETLRGKFKNFRQNGPW